MEFTLSRNTKGILLLLGASLISALVLKRLFSKRPNSLLKKRINQLNPSCIEKIQTHEETIVDNEINFIVFVRNQETAKPKRGAKVTNPFLYPFESGIHITNFGNKYRLLFNKYPILDKHLLLVTYQFEKQSDPLTKEDLDQTFKIINEIDGFAFFNSGEHSGYSQEHKHIQLIPNQSLSRFPLESQVQSSIQEGPFTLEAFEFKHFFHTITNSEELFKIYSKLLNLLSPSSYNLIITQTWMLMVSRAKERSYNKFDLNSMAYTGILLVKNQEELKFIKEVGPLQVLKDAAMKD
jgi:ATP adenylyltransferase